MSAEQNFVKITNNKIKLKTMNFYQDLSVKNKKYTRAVLLILLVGLAATSLTAALEYLIRAKQEWRQTKSFYSSRQISVSGKGEKSVKPDIALISFAVVTSGKKLKAAQDANSQKSSAVMDFLKAKGVEEKDLKTTFYQITPQYQYYDNPPCYSSPCPPRRLPEIVSYEIKNRVEVKVRDLGKVDELLEGVVEKGANDVDSVKFQIDDEEKVLAEVRELAIKDAREQAEKLAKDLGVRLGKVLNFYEGGPIMPYAQEAYGLGVGGAGVSLKAVSAPSIQPGEQEIQSNVTITYELK